MEDNKKNIIINLSESTYAHGFGKENQVHQLEMERAFVLIQKQLKDVGDKQLMDICLNHKYNTIGIFGDRGAGKTSFLVSLLEKCKRELSDVVVLKIIDPTLVEHKKPIVLCIISMINEIVENELRKEECENNEGAYLRRNMWRQTLANVSTGVHAIENVGKGYSDLLWEDEVYVLDKGLAKVKCANDFEQNLQKMICMALEILCKKVFILSFDDIDVDVEQGWKVLETLRRYLSCEKLITIVSGNLKLYGMLVRNELSKNLTFENGILKNQMANELESQYILKLLKPSNRINLFSLSNLLQYDELSIKVCKDSKSPVTPLVEVYNDFLCNYGVSDSASVNIFKDFLLSMSLRTQIHFLTEILSSDDNFPLDVFASRLFAADIDIQSLRKNPQITIIAILNYLTLIESLRDCYLLLPNLSNKDVNSNFTALSLLVCNHLKKVPYVFFDYLLRIGYVRNVILPWENKDMLSQLCKYAGWYQMMSLKNNIGMTMAYITAKEGELKEHIKIYGMAKDAKKSKDSNLDSFDAVLTAQPNSISKLVAIFPFVRILHEKKKGSDNFYSIFALLAVIADLLKCETLDETISEIDYLKVFRSYRTPFDTIGANGNLDVESDIVIGEIGQENVSTLAKLMYDWKNSFKPNSNLLPPYVIGRIMTRLFSAAMNVEGQTVGEKMNVMVSIFINACLIEEAKLKFSGTEFATININNNNPRENVSILINNIDNIKNQKIHEMCFTQWIMRCPMLNAFLDDTVYEHLLLGDDEKSDKNNFKQRIISVYEFLTKIKIKKNSMTVLVQNRPAFSGAKREIKKMIQLMEKRGLSETQIANLFTKDQSIESVCKALEDLEIFRSVKKNSVKSFINNFASQA